MDLMIPFTTVCLFEAEVTSHETSKKLVIYTNIHYSIHRSLSNTDKDSTILDTSHLYLIKKKKIEEKKEN